MFKITGNNTSAIFTIDDVENTAIEQVRALCNHPACTNPIVLMPDVHAGCASPIGFTMELNDKVVPNIVSVDVGCGMLAVKYDILAKDFLSSNSDMQAFNRNVRQVVPMGFNIHANPKAMWYQPEFYAELNASLGAFHDEYERRYGTANTNPLQVIQSLSDFNDYITKFAGKPERILNAIGTLGGGNHFGECSEGSDGKLWITIHCGSRNFGKQVCDFHQNKAWENILDAKVNGKQEYIQSLKDKIVEGSFLRSDLEEAITEYDRTFDFNGITKQNAYLMGTDMYEYLFDMVVAQTYADWNRKIIQYAINIFVYAEVLETINTTHNYINFKDFIIRKGAIDAYSGDKVIIPFNPVDGILICEGKSNPDWNYSAPHGAGRIMSRTQANKEITPERAKEVMQGVYASETPVDESPLCYKDASMIETAIDPTATIIDRLKPILNFKAK